MEGEEGGVGEGSLEALVLVAEGVVLAGELRP
jgi:hypothetical protein